MPLETLYLKPVGRLLVRLRGRLRCSSTSAVDETEKRRLEGVIKEQRIKLAVCKEEAEKLASEDAAIRAEGKEIKDKLVRYTALTGPCVLGD